ncbi:hypothetical protein ACQKP8_23070 [Photobacterium alginatilyticum]|uniref:hypothetical protein n=1 Tax=Photobacterium alginatilyticum TaxID=1775171 RepID=UPI00406787BE
MPKRPYHSYTLPVLTTTEHLLPLTKQQISGSGALFSQMILEATRAGGIWIVMQDSNGEVADKAGDIVTFASIDCVDWLSGDQVQVSLDLPQWGAVDTEQDKTPGRYLSASLFPLWHCSHKLSTTDRLVVQLRQWQKEYAHQGPANDPGRTDYEDPCWLCWRWLEVLPLPVHTKQRLLKQPGPNSSLRYLKKMIRQSDLYAELLR